MRGFEPLTLTLRMQRPHPSDRAKHALTGGNVLNVSHHSVWFLSVSRTRRARSPIPPHPQRRPIRCPARPSRIPTPIVNPADTAEETNRAAAISSTGRSPPARGVQPTQIIARNTSSRICMAQRFSPFVWINDGGVVGDIEVMVLKRS